VDPSAHGLVDTHVCGIETGVEPDARSYGCRIRTIHAIEAGSTIKERDRVLVSPAQVAATNSGSEEACDKLSDIRRGGDVEGVARVRCRRAAKLWSEGLSRYFSNRRRSPLTRAFAPTTAERIAHEQSVSKAGNPRLRAPMVQIARLWLRHQP
jgi:hypothetical protein